MLQQRITARILTSMVYKHVALFVLRAQDSPALSTQAITHALRYPDQQCNVAEHASSVMQRQKVVCIKRTHCV